MEREIKADMVSYGSDVSSSTAKRRVAVTERDRDLFSALYRSPLTAEQIFKLSETFAEPFPTLRRTQARLGQLAASGMLHAWRYATMGQGSAPHYYKLSPETFRLLFGDKAVLPSKRFLHEVKVSQHEHKRLLGDFTVHTAVAAHRRGLSFVYFHPENTHRIETADGTIFPDQAFGLHLPPSTQLNYYVELDNSTEPIRSTDRMDSWQNRLRRYYQNEANSIERSRLIIVSTKNGSRLANILDLARRLNPNLSYSMAVGVILSDYLAESDPFFVPCFRDQHNQRVPLIRAFAGTAAVMLPSAPDRQASALMV